MKTPPATINTKGQADKGTVFLCSAHHPKRDSTECHLQEFGLEIDGTTSTCYALTSATDVIDIDYAFNKGIVGFIDVIVDGVRRKTIFGRAGSTNRATINRGLYMARGKDGKRAGLKNCLMQVKVRELTGEDEIDDEMVPSALGSIILQVFQKRQLGEDEEPEADTAPAQRYPDFEELATWKETSNRNIFPINDVPSLEME